MVTFFPRHEPFAEFHHGPIGKLRNHKCSLSRPHPSTNPRTGSDWTWAPMFVTERGDRARGPVALGHCSQASRPFGFSVLDLLPADPSEAVWLS